MRRLVLAAVMLVAFVLAGPAWAAERVLYCTETDVVGFVWNEGQTEGRVTEFKGRRYVVKVQSEEMRTVTPTVGDTAGKTTTLACRKPYASYSIFTDLLVCDSGNGTSPWLFNGNNFEHAFLHGKHAGGWDPNIMVSYGACTGF